jgi:hypothetical protein
VDAFLFFFFLSEGWSSNGSALDECEELLRAAVKSQERNKKK